MRKKLTHEDFVKKASQVHDNKYKYPEKYINSATPIKIHCFIAKHGTFKQSPNNHINKKNGCPQCSIEKQKKSFDQFLIDFISTHGDQYDYTKIKKEKIVNNKSIIEILCKKHNLFFKQRINNHLNGQGCPLCKKEKIGIVKRLSKKEFLLKANEKHKGKYQYKNYKSASENLTIICPLHGDFKQIAQKHYQGHGCPKCSKIRKLTPEIFKEKANAKHGKKIYDYSLIKTIKNNKTVVPINCLKHGLFFQKPNDHMNGYGCPRCGNLVSKFQKELYQTLKQTFPNEEIKLEKRIVIKNNKFIQADICFVKYNIVIEYYGDYWHCNPKKYKSDYYNKKVHMTAKDIWNKDKNRINELKNNSYKTFIVWEYDYKTNKENTLKELINNLKYYIYDK